MSGYKHATVTISQEEYRRLNESGMKKRFREYADIKAQESEQTVGPGNLLEQMQMRQRQLEEALTTLGQNFNQVDDETIQEILTQNALCYEGLAATLEESTSGMSDSLAQMSERFSEEMQNERDHYRQNLNSIFQRLDTQRQRENNKEEVALEWLTRGAILADFIQDQFDHERFVPGRLTKILRCLDFAQSNLAEGLAESSLQSSQHLYLELSDLHLELEQRVIQWQTDYDRTYSFIRQVIDELESNTRVNALGLQGELLPEQVDLDFWTKGKYHQLLGHSRLLLEFLVQDQQSLSTEDFTRICSQVLPAIRESFESIVYGARFNALNSQLRMNIAERAMQALENHGFALGEAGYANSDMRASFSAHLDSPDGSQVLIQVLPTERTDQELTNELVMITKHRYLMTEHEARLQWEELTRTLNQSNLEVSRPDVHPIPAPSLPDHIEYSPPVNQKFTRSEG